MLAQRLIAQADKKKGRFRTFLLRALDNFVIDELRREQAQARRPRGGFESTDDLAQRGEASMVSETPDPFAQEWARTVIAEAVQRVRAECEAKGQSERWGVFQARVLEPMLNGTEPAPYGELVGRFGFHTTAEASNALITGKRAFGRCLRAVVSEYAKAGEIDEELRELRAILGRGQ